MRRPATALRSAPPAWKTGGRGGWKPFPHRQQGVSRRAIALRRQLPRILTAAEAQAILDGCTRLRDRFFFALLYDSGCRVGEALGLRHEDIAAAEQEVSIVARENANGARAKSGGRSVQVGPELIRLYADYREYRRHRQRSRLREYLGGARTRMVYQAVCDLVLRLRARTDRRSHWFRTRRDQVAARWRRSSRLHVAGHSSVAVTSWSTTV
jgi:integrase